MDTNVDWAIKLNINANNYKIAINKKIKLLKEIDVTNKSTRGKKSKQYDLFETFKNDSDLYFIVDEIKKYITEQLKSIIKYDFSLILNSAWTVIGRKGSFHTVHKHNEKIPHLSVILYLETPKISADYEGAFYFFFNRNGTVECQQLIPKTNDCLVMPVWIYHGVYPQGSGKRQTLNFGFEVVPT